jgi:hypothetical protein
VNIPEETLKMKLSNSLPNSEQRNKFFPERFKSVLKNEDYSGSFNRVGTWLRNKSVQNQNAKNERRFVKMKYYFFSHKIRFVYAVIFLALVVAACNMPVTTHETMGHVIAWTIPEGNSGAADQINKLGWINRENLTMNENVDHGRKEMLYTLTLPGTNEEQVNAYKQDLESIKDVTSIKILPLYDNVKRPLYSAALYRFFRINVNATNMTDAELQQEITDKLREAGVVNIENPDIEIKTDENGRRMINMKISCDQIKDPQNNVELRVDDGNSKEVMKIISNKLDAEKINRMTDQEIIDYVKKNNPDVNLKDSDMKIVREGNKIKVQVEKKDIKK